MKLFELKVLKELKILKKRWSGFVDNYQNQESKQPNPGRKDAQFTEHAVLCV
jgi:hypothetical protein